MRCATAKNPQILLGRFLVNWNVRKKNGGQSRIQKLFHVFFTTLKRSQRVYTWKWMVGIRLDFPFGANSLFSGAFAFSFREGKIGRNVSLWLEGLFVPTFHSYWGLPIARWFENKHHPVSKQTYSSTRPKILQHLFFGGGWNVSYKYRTLHNIQLKLLSLLPRFTQDAIVATTRMITHVFVSGTTWGKPKNHPVAGNWKFDSKPPPVYTAKHTRIIPKNTSPPPKHSLGPKEPKRRNGKKIRAVLILNVGFKTTSRFFTRLSQGLRETKRKHQVMFFSLHHGEVCWNSCFSYSCLMNLFTDVFYRHPNKKWCNIIYIIRYTYTYIVHSYISTFPWSSPILISCWSGKNTLSHNHCFLDIEFWRV